MKFDKSILSHDQTSKYFFATEDGFSVESCLLNLEKHGTIICISSQVGCNQTCKFCASGRLKFFRNLTVNELVEQVAYIYEKNPDFFKEKFQITYMGSGEPLNNIDAVTDTMDIFYSRFKNLEKINVSTIIPYIPTQNITDRFTHENKFHIQFSLHASNDEARRRMFGRGLPRIADSLEYVSSLAKKNNDCAAINYMLIEGVNDTDEDAQRLAFLKKIDNVYLKISRLCEIKASNFKPSLNFENFSKRIQDIGIKFEYFESKGSDINAGCGQFYNESII